MFDVVIIFIVATPVPPAGNVKLDGARDVVGPAGETVADNFTSPANLFRLVIVIIDVPLTPAVRLCEAGPPTRLKVGAAAGSTVTEMAIAWNPLLVPFTITG